MPAPDAPTRDEPRERSEEFVHAVSGLFECLGRALVCLDDEFRVMHASEGLDGIAGPDARRAILGMPAERVLGAELFGADGTLRRALAAGERREGWGATLTIPGRERHVLSLSAAPVRGVTSSLCDPRVAYLLVVRSVAAPGSTGGLRPTLFAGMTGHSAAMRRIFDLVLSLSASEATVLITGESGTGKELVARALHENSPRHAGPFVGVNCGALPGELLESELFGHVRGAFTGAVRDRRGRFEVARGGTLFLDEVGDLSLPLQVKLLRVLQERSYERVGESTSQVADARIVAATNRDLPRDVREGRFRDDLYYRLRVVPIAIPPLRERREDIELLAWHLLGRVGARQGRSLLLSPDVVRLLLEYPWPGNARELENALEYAVAVCRGQTLHPGDLPAEVREFRPAAGPARGERVPPQAVPAREAAMADDREERVRLSRALEAHRWNRVATAAALGVSRSTLWRRMRELGLER